MAVPGFSVSDLIAAVGHVKILYDAFFNKYTGSAVQIRYLAEDIEQFQVNLKTHREIIERRGLAFSGYSAIDRTLNECADFLDKYKVLLDKNLSAEKAYRTARFQYDQDAVARLRGQLASHGNNILHLKINLLLENSLRREDTITQARVSQPLKIPDRSSVTFTPPSSPPVAPMSPQFLQEGNLSGSPSSIARSPKWGSSSSLKSKPESKQASPRTEPIVMESRNEYEVGHYGPDVILPEPALPYTVAEVCFGKKMVGLKRKLRGRNSAKGRELVVVDDKGKARFSHKIKLPSNRGCYPYTWHRRWSGHDLEVTFKGPVEELHSVEIKSQPAPSGIPHYVFTKHEDYVQFQAEVRGKHLVDLFNFRRLETAVGREATDQHLKIWKHPDTLDHSVSFYASLAEKARDLEFPISMFKPDLESHEGLYVDLDFTIAAESNSPLLKKFSRSSTERTTSSVVSSEPPGIFSRQQTGFSTGSGSITTAAASSRMSRTSLASDSSQTHSDQAKSNPSTLESQAKKMKYLNIEFSDAEEASRFRAAYDKAVREDASLQVEFIMDWQRGASDPNRAASVVSSGSVSGTPFEMSPILQGQSSPILRPQR